MTKQEILDKFNDIDFVYNDSSKHETLSRMIDELLKEQEAKWIHREDLDFKDKLGCNHFHGMCGNCGFIHDFIDGHTGQYKYCPQCEQKLDWEGR